MDRQPRGKHHLPLVIIALSHHVTGRALARLVTGVLMLACVSCGGTAPTSVTPTGTAPPPPPAQIPAAALLTTDGQAVQNGVRFAHTWIVDGRIQLVDPKPPLPWPPPATHQSAEDLLISIPGAPSPVWVEARVYDKLDPTGDPLHINTCDPGSGAACSTVRLAVPPGGNRMITVNASWPVPKALAREVRMPANMASLRAAWLFRLAA